MDGNVADVIDLGDPAEYAGNEVSEWVSNVVGLPQFTSHFSDNGFFDLKDVARLDQALLTTLGIVPLGYTLRFVRFIEELSGGCNNSNSTAAKGIDINTTNAAANGVVSAALITEWKGLAFNAILNGGGVTLSEVRSNVVNATSKVRFNKINDKKNAVGQKINSGHLVAKRAAFHLENVGILELYDKYDPTTAPRRGRGGSQYYGCRIRRIGLAAAYDAGDQDDRDGLRRFIKTYTNIDWRNYILGCGDGRRVRELGLYEV